LSAFTKLFVASTQQQYALQTPIMASFEDYAPVLGVCRFTVFPVMPTKYEFFSRPYLSRQKARLIMPQF
jgi:hypothetical protein